MLKRIYLFYAREGLAITTELLPGYWLFTDSQFERVDLSCDLLNGPAVIEKARE